MKKLHPALKFLIGVASLAAVFTVIGLFMGSEWEVEREVEVDLPVAEVGLRLSDPAKWPEWWPSWQGLDDETREKAFSVDGSTLKWELDGVQGSLTLIPTDGGLDYQVRLDGDPAERGVITWAAQGDAATTVRWEISGDVGGHPWRRWVVATGVIQSRMAEVVENALAALAQ